MNVLITDQRSDLASMVREFLTDSGHSVEVVDSASQDSLKGKHFDLVIDNLDKTVEKIKSLNEASEKAEQAITLFIAEWLENVRTKGKFSFAQLGNWLLELKKTGNLELATLNKKTASKIVRLFETGNFCLLYEYLEVVASACSQEGELERILDSIEIEFDLKKEESKHKVITVLLGIYYKKRLSNIEKIINPSNVDNLLNFSHSKFKKEG